MRRKMNLHLFDTGDGGEGGATGSAGAAGGAGAGGTGGTGNGGQGGNAGFTYEQLDEIANARAQRAERAALSDFFRRQGMSETEITSAINDYKSKKEQSKPNLTELEKQLDAAKQEAAQLKNSNTLRDKGVRAEDLDYVMFKVDKMVDDKTDFAKAAEKFLKDNPRFAGGGTYRVSTSTGTETAGSGGDLNSSINAAIRAAARR